MAFIYVLIASVASYALTSLVLLHYPQILHEKKAKRRKCYHISHRGGAGENYENTLSAFTHAVNLGTDMLELDCHITKDKKVVVAHDSSLLRTTGQNMLIKDLNYDQLPLLNTTLDIEFDPGNYFHGSEDENSRRIPLLSDIFKTFPDVVVNIDVKEGSDELIDEINKLIIDYQREEITIWGSFKEVGSLKCFNKNPKVGRYFSMNGAIKLYLYFYTGLLPFIPLNETHLEIFLPEVFLLTRTKQNAKLTLKQQLTLWFAGLVVNRPALINHLNRRGIQTYMWVLNDEKHFKKASSLGVTGIMTDYPTKLRRFLNEQ